jgi:predicted AlkP superfamily phosphohydrolase/phosphomutase
MVLIVSDHGGGPAATNYFNTNAWLLDNGYLRVARGKDNLAKDMHKTVLFLRHLMDTPLGNVVRQWLPTKMVDQGRSLVRNIAQINWHETRAYRFPIYPPLEGIVINVAGRQPQGIVNPGADYERIRHEICDQLRHIAEPVSGAPLIVDIFLREEIYSGPHIERSPDIILILKENYSGGTGLGSTLVTPVDPQALRKVNGEHRMNGILLAQGPMVQAGRMIESASLQDIAPTLLYSLGLPISNQMDGVVLKDLFIDDFLKENIEDKSMDLDDMKSALPEFSLTKEEELQIEVQLKKLGYL